MQTKLVRIVNKNERYYILNITSTLFGTFCLERIYGASRYKTPTRKIQNFFSSKDEVNNQYNIILKNKLKKGYKIFSNSNPKIKSTQYIL